MAKLKTAVCISVVAANLWTNHARAIPIEVSLVPVDNSSGGVELNGFTTTDIVLTIPGLHTGSQMLIELEQGSIFQHSLGDTTPPSSGAVELFPALGFDTYLAFGNHSSSGPYGAFNAFGAAIDLRRGARPLAFNETLVDVAWGPAAGGNLPNNTDGFVAARVTLSEDAVGRWLYLASSIDEFTVIAPEDYPIPQTTPIVRAGSGLIRSGQLHLVVAVPEPASLGLVCAAGLASLALRSRTRIAVRTTGRSRLGAGMASRGPNPAQDLLADALANSRRAAIY
jgi:hypothetical protein